MIIIIIKYFSKTKQQKLNFAKTIDKAIVL